jgi:predicted DNA-binding protein YlxM (UPF0122 family)
LNNEVDLNTVMELYKSGMHINDIAEKFDIPTTTLRDRLYREGFKLSRYRLFDNDILDKAIKLYTCKRKGCNCKQIAKKLNVHEKTVRFNLIEAGIRIKGKKIQFSEDKINHIISLYVHEKNSFMEIGRKLSVHGSVIKKLLIKHDIQLRTQSEQMKYTTKRRLNGEIIK